MVIHRNSQRLILIAVLFFFQFFLRAHNITRQEAFVDEGLHNERALLVWHFNVNPTEISQGKLLLYYWLGLFEGSTTTALFTSRIAIALFSLIGGAALFALGKRCFGPTVAMFALAIYTVFPLAVFYERMALADPFAAVFSNLVALWSVEFARRPTPRNSILVGVLLALATLAKLTLVMLPVLPIISALIYAQARRSEPQWLAWARCYAKPFVIIAVTFALVWSPFILPNFITYAVSGGVSGQAPSLFVNSDNLVQPGSVALSLQDYTLRLLKNISDFIPLPILLTGIVCMLLVLLIVIIRGLNWQPYLFLFLWAQIIIVPTIIGAALDRSRYIMPVTAPLVLLMVGSAHYVWSINRGRWLMRTLVGGFFGSSFIFSALPFVFTTLHSPDRLALTGTNLTDYLQSDVNSDEIIRIIAARLSGDDLILSGGAVYSDWKTCHLLFFYSNRSLNCLPRENGLSELRIMQSVMKAIDTDHSIWLITTNMNEEMRINTGMCALLRERFVRRYARPVDVWQISKPPC